MKRYMKCCLVFAFCLCFFGCNGKIQKTDREFEIIASNFPLYDIARAVGGQEVQVKLLLKPGVESHSFEPSPKDIIGIEQADLFLCIGGESEAWVKSLAGNHTLSLIHSVELHHHEGHDHGIDEHIWTNPEHVKKMAEVICDELCNLHPEKRDVYQNNLNQYKEELSQLDARFRKTVQEGKRKKVVFADRFPFLYFSEKYGLEYLAAFPGCASQAEPSAAQMKTLITTVKQETIPVIFYLELSNQTIADAVSEETGAKKALFHSCHNVTQEEFEAGETYLSLMNQNCDRLEEALN